MTKIIEIWPHQNPIIQKRRILNTVKTQYTATNNTEIHITYYTKKSGGS